ncbi:MAG: hypothetical protein CL609_18420 [Anaerolineaceae bacterium]|nr:hypothetical protein [Anaerolineaceae bacterium]
MDIFNKKKSSQLQEQAMLLSAVGAPVMAVNPDFVVTYMNEAGASLVGKQAQECVGLHCYDLFQTNHCQTKNCRVHQAMETKQIREGRTISKAGGKITPIQYAANALLDEKGNVIGAVEYVMNLQEIYTVCETVSNMSGEIGSASAQMAAAALQSGQATNQIASTITQVASGTQQQTTFINTTATSVEQMARTVDGVARGAQEQANAIDKAAQLTGRLASMIQEVADSAQASVKGSNQAADAARKGSQKVEDNLRAMHEIKSKVGQSAQKVKEMGVRSNQIGVIVETIDDIASQTNLLALNAAIEAARAGEHGKGFAVVADEVRKLAEKSAAATKEIADLINAIQITVSEAVDAMSASATEVEKGVEGANQSGSALNEILDSAEQVRVQVEKIAASAQQMSATADEMVNSMDSVSAVVEENTAATEQMSASAGELTQAIENIASISEENAAAVEEVSASTEEMNAQVVDVSQSSQDLKTMADRLVTSVAGFKFD